VLEVVVRRGIANLAPFNQPGRVSRPESVAFFSPEANLLFSLIYYASSHSLRD
jgi:hypothetical protein